MTSPSPITPPPELVQQWYLGARACPPDQWVTDIATRAAKWGMLQERQLWLKAIKKRNAKVQAKHNVVQTTQNIS